MTERRGEHFYSPRQVKARKLIKPIFLTIAAIIILLFSVLLISTGNANLHDSLKRLSIYFCRPA